MYVVLLANTVKEAMDYARARKLPRGGFRYASRASTIKGLRVAEVHVLPGFARRPDRFAIAATLKYTRSRTVEVSQEEYDQLVNAYPLEKALEIGFRYEAILEASRGEEAGEAEPSEDAAPAEQEPDRQRRSRCRVCSQLVWGPRDPAHDGAAHDARVAVSPPRPAADPAGVWF